MLVICAVWVACLPGLVQLRGMLPSPQGSADQLLCPSTQSSRSSTPSQGEIVWCPLLIRYRIRPGRPPNYSAQNVADPASKPKARGRVRPRYRSTSLVCSCTNPHCFSTTEAFGRIAGEGHFRLPCKMGQYFQAKFTPSMILWHAKEARTKQRL